MAAHKAGVHQADARGGAHRTSPLRRWAPLGAIVALAAFAWAMGWHRYLTPTALVEHRAALRGFVEAQAPLAAMAYAGAYVAVVALSLPVGALASITGGLLFGCLLGGGLAVLSATCGATVIFLVARTAAGDALVRRAGGLTKRMAEGFRENGLCYMLFLRLMPVFPFWLVNLAAGALRIPLRTFFLGTLVGIVPATFAYALVGSTFDGVIAGQERQLSDCRAQGRADCRADLVLSDFLSPELVLALAALGIVSLVPILLKKIKARRAAA